MSLSNLHPNHQRPLQLTNPHTNHRRHLPPERAPRRAFPLLRIRQLNRKLPQQRAAQLVDVGLRHRLADALAPAKAEVHQVPRAGAEGGKRPARWVEDGVVGAPDRRVVVEGVVADCDGRLGGWRG